MKALLAAAALVLVGGTAVAQPEEPRRDARGIPVQSEPATPPPGVGSSPAPAADQQAPFATRPATTTYPPCTRGQTDRCVQTYERGSRRSR
jgi:hypothetical protein